MADTLYATLTEEEQHQWTDQELRDTLTKVRPMVSVTLQDRLDPGMNTLATVAPQASSFGFQSNTQSPALPTGQPTGQPAGQPAVYPPVLPPAQLPQLPLATQQPPGLPPALFPLTPQGFQPQYYPGQYHPEQYYRLPAAPAAPPAVPEATYTAPPPAATPIAGYAAPPPWHQPPVQGAPPRPVNYSKEVTTVAKIYTDSEKYDGIGDSFDFKLTIFRDIC